MAATDAFEQLLDDLTAEPSADGVASLVASRAGIVHLWDLSETEPRCLARLYEASPVTGLVVTHDGYVDGPQKALDNVRFADGWALYDLDDLPERHSPDAFGRCSLLRPAARAPDGQPSRVLTLDRSPNARLAGLSTAVREPSEAPDVLPIIHSQPLARPIFNRSAARPPFARMSVDNCPIGGRLPECRSTIARSAAVGASLLG